MNHYHKANTYFLLFFCALFLGMHPCDAQTNHQQDSLEVKRLTDSARNSWYTDTEKALQFAKQVLEFSQKKQYTRGIAQGYVLLGTVYDRKSEWAKAITYYQQALDIAKKANDSRQIGVVYYNMAGTYHNQSAYDKSFEAATAALAIKTSLKDSIGMAACYRVIAGIYRYKEEFEKAAPYIENAIAIQRKLKTKKSLAKMLADAGIIYTNLGQYDKSLAYLKEAEGYINDEGAEPVGVSIYNNIGICYFKMGKLNEAEQYYLLSLKEFEFIEDKWAEILVNNNLGQIYVSENKNELAEKHLLRALALATEQHSIEDLSNIHGNLADLYFSKKDFKQAYEHKELFMAFGDSLLNEEKMKAIEELTIKFETKEIAYKNKQLEQKVNEQKYTIVRNLFWLYGSLSVAAIIALIAFFYIRQNKLKASLERMELEQQQYRAQMNPHFIFNCLNSIQYYIVHNDVAAANKYLSEFASLMRKTLENNKLESIGLNQEIEYLQSYLLLEQMRFENKFSYEIVCAENVNVFALKILPMIIQPFAENAIVHGLCYLESNGKLLISFEKDGTQLICKIDDNGIGRAASQALKTQAGKNHISQGLALIQKRLALVSTLTKQKFEMEIIDKPVTDGHSTGTLVILKFPATI